MQCILARNTLSPPLLPLYNAASFFAETLLPGSYICSIGAAFVFFLDRIRRKCGANELGSPARRKKIEKNRKREKKLGEFVDSGGFGLSFRTVPARGSPGEGKRVASTGNYLQFPSWLLIIVCYFFSESCEPLLLAVSTAGSLREAASRWGFGVDSFFLPSSSFFLILDFFFYFHSDEERESEGDIDNVYKAHLFQTKYSFVAS